VEGDSGTLIRHRVGVGVTDLFDRDEKHMSTWTVHALSDRNDRL